MEDHRTSGGCLTAPKPTHEIYLKYRQIEWFLWIRRKLFGSVIKVLRLLIRIHENRKFNLKYSVALDLFFLWDWRHHPEGKILPSKPTIIQVGIEDESSRRTRGKPKQILAKKTSSNRTRRPKSRPSSSREWKLPESEMIYKNQRLTTFAKLNTTHTQIIYIKWTTQNNAIIAELPTEHALPRTDSTPS